MSDGLTIRRATLGDHDAVVRLIRESMGPDDAVEWTEAFWRWKHEMNPFGTSPVLLAEDDGRPVGLRTFMRWAWKSGTATVPAVRAVDTATHPDYRGRGIFRRLTTQLRDEMGQEGVAMVFNTPNDMSRPGYLKMGWQRVGNLTVWVHPVRPVRIAAGALGRGAAPEAAPSVRARTAADALASGEAVEIAQRLQPTGAARYHTPVTLDYLRWRYALMPGSDYHVVTEGEGGSGALLVVRARTRGSLRELRVCEAIANSTPLARRNLRVLLRRAGELADVDVVIAMATPEAGRGILISSGYVPVPRSGPTLTAYPLNTPVGAPSPTTLSNWSASIGSLELF